MYGKSGVLASLLCAFFMLISSHSGSWAQSSDQGVAAEQQQQAEWNLTWPREFTDRHGNQLVLYQPQIDEWKDYQLLTGRLAAAFTAKGSETQEFGVVTLSAKTQADLDTKEVAVYNIAVEEIEFPDLGGKAFGKVAVQIGPCCRATQW